MFKKKSEKTALLLEINGTEHTIDVTKNNKEYIVTIDGQEYKTFTPQENSFWGMVPVHDDFLIEVQGEQIILALREEEFRLAKNGKYIDNGEVFVPREPLPIWAWIFVAANFALIFLGGVLGAILGVIIGLGCLPIARKSATPVVTRILICTGMTIAAWLAYFFIAIPLWAWVLS